MNNGFKSLGTYAFLKFKKQYIMRPVACAEGDIKLKYLSQQN